MADAQLLNSVEIKSKHKYKLLQHVFVKLEKDNERILYTLRRAKDSISMLRSERTILFERLQKMGSNKRLGLAKDSGAYERSDGEIEDPSLVILNSDEERKLFQSRSKDVSAPKPKKKSTSKVVKGKPKAVKKTGASAAANSPRRPKNSYIIFTNHIREQLKDELQVKGVGEQAKFISQKWKELSSEEKEKYREMSLKDSERYATEKQQQTPEEPMPVSVNIES